MEFIWYPRCSTCIKANKHLLEKHLTFTTRHIVEQTPSLEELKKQMYKDIDFGIKYYANVTEMC